MKGGWALGERGGGVDEVEGLMVKGKKHLTHIAFLFWGFSRTSSDTILTAPHRLLLENIVGTMVSHVWLLQLPMCG